MKPLERNFTAFVNYFLRILFFLILLGSIIIAIGVLVRLSKTEVTVLFLCALLLLAVSMGAAYFVYRYLKYERNYTAAIAVIIGVSLILRVCWILFSDVKPFSDFSLIYDSGARFADGEYWVFKGTSYIARFPHLTMLTIYSGIFQKVFTNALLGIKLVNTVLSVISVYIIYLIGGELYNNKSEGIWCAFAASLFPPFILYNSVVCSENIAMPFFLGSIYIFILVVNGKRNLTWLFFSGILLSLGNLFRMVAYVVAIAYIMYLAIYWQKKKLIKSCAIILMAFFIPLYITNLLLMSSGITEYPLWKGREPSITSVLKGTNIDTLGMWNEEDSKVAERYDYNYGAVETAAKEIIKARLTDTPFYKLLAFYAMKFAAQWSSGDFSAVYWSTGRIEILGTAASFSTLVFFYAQILFIIIILFALRGLFNRRQYMENKVINLFYIIFCGYGLFYLITEQQPRYGYIVSWIFIILMFTYTKRCKELVHEDKF
ncbi:dolichyl-phosphate-mannose-protein mannosyltransferase [Ruminiclostridium sufflavum DSM 19573]|uniref:Dolichyl-phosphate-mannose-protein mannosyltransferase n=1 Tax=Ruminiclostridium sufflavum DSM 19573 TaxID=1121337 RepID=A0A318XLN4_9FIRM|nr:glycosyltransferase family 39 protein [Ruminiclostridium sufflavum]PYG87318.1 dolichyl-phosphate-mannose-protein mannosyltransferase [Ruminiclostridium sufflavum DSM 19573]